METQFHGWSLFDALIQHNGKLPTNRIHEEHVTTDDMITAISNYTKEHRNDRACKCIVFTTGGAMDLVYLSPDTNDPADKLRVDDLFPNGAISIKLLELPGKAEKLTYDHRIFVSSGRGASPTNIFVKQALDIEWGGNIIMVPYSIAGPRRRKMNSIPWGPSSKQLLTLILKYFLNHYGRIEAAFAKEISSDDDLGIVSSINESE